MARKINSNKVERIQYDLKKDFNTGVVTDYCIVNPEDVKINNKSNKKLKSGRHFSTNVKGDVL